MKVLSISYLFPNSQYPNYGVFVLNRIKALKKYCDVKVINPIPWFPLYTRFSRYRNFERITRFENINGVDVYHPRFFIIPKYFKSLDAVSFASSVIPLALRIQKKFDFDLIDLHWTYPDLPCGALLSKLTGKPLITTIRGHEAFYANEPGVRKNIIEMLLKKSKRVITLSEKLKNASVQAGVKAGCVSVIRNGVDSGKFKYFPQIDAKQMLGISPDTQILLSVGSLIEGKGFDRIISALRHVIEKYPKVKLYLIGSEGAAGFYKKELIKQIEQLNLQQYVNFVGEVENDELKYWYSAADLFCLASRREGSPNVLNEAISCGCPAVATDVGSVAEIMQKGYLGFVIPNSDDVLSGILSGFKKAFNRENISNYMLKYDWDWCANQVHAVFQEAVDEVA